MAKATNEFPSWGGQWVVEVEPKGTKRQLLRKDTKFKKKDNPLGYNTEQGEVVVFTGATAVQDAAQVAAAWKGGK